VRGVVAGLSVLCVVLAAVSLNSYIQLRDYKARLELAFKMTNPTKLEDLSLLERQAAQEWATKNNITLSQAVANRDVRAFRMDDQTCVVLLLERGALGDSPVYCFDESGTLSARFDDIE
jgi:hypothetical protein